MEPSIDHQKQLQRNLLDFLRAELNLGFTLCRTAQSEKVHDSRRFANTLDNIEKVLINVRRFDATIAKSESFHQIRQRAAELQELVGKLKSERHVG